MYEIERQDLVRHLHSRGITDKSVLHAFLKVERHEFVLPAMKHLAYRDNALPLSKGQTISQPYTVAIMTQMLNVKEGDKVLEIGTGSGYQAAILQAMDARVFSIERDYDLFVETTQRLLRMNIPVRTLCGDGTIGWTEFAPYQGIIVTAGGPKVPESLKLQLDIGARLVIPVGTRHHQALHTIQRTDEKSFTTEIVPDFLFVPLIGREGWKDEP